MFRLVFNQFKVKSSPSFKEYFSSQSNIFLTWNYQEDNLNPYLIFLINLNNFMKSTLVIIQIFFTKFFIEIASLVEICHEYLVSFRDKFIVASTTSSIKINDFSDILHHLNASLFQLMHQHSSRNNSIKLLTWPIDICSSCKNNWEIISFKEAHKMKIIKMLC